ncbi:MAG: hypothetical protein KAU03_03325, partial [Candidatus Altiarchaeales archaeon]|nr:hypothetical protein [Candidatus Altiarchaeales archaeon]
IPEINMDEMPQIAKTARDIGVQIMNIMPLIPLYNLKKLRRPTRDEMNTARDLSEKYLPLFKWCKQCRADAFGIPGEHDFNLSEIGYRVHEHNFNLSDIGYGLHVHYADQCGNLGGTYKTIGGGQLCQLKKNIG